MAESLTISTAPPPLKSMDYSLLREEGLRHIQELAGKVWTDENAHDPGITILEMLAYAITDLGYRTNYHIRDILATETPQDIKNFFAAKEIMPNYPWTFNDYRKLMMDVEITLPDLPTCESVGVKNAWIEISQDSEIAYYPDAVNEKLTYRQPDPTVNRLQPYCLYNVLLEFGSCELLGDLNANTLSGKITVNGLESPPLPTFDMNLNGTIVEFEVEFARWDTPGIDWNDTLAIRKTIKRIDLKFSRLPEEYTVSASGVYNSGLNQGQVWLTLLRNFTYPVASDQAIADMINAVIYDSSFFPGLCGTYQLKVQSIFSILEKVKATLMEHRNLGDDFFRYNAIKVDEIALCTVVELANSADVEEVYAQIMYQVEQFLDPTVFFYSLGEMYDKGYTTDQIFEGPLLDHGFIEDKELLRAERRKTIHVSDLISIIMDIPGVLAVKKIQIAGIPLDNDDNLSVDSVKWCLEIPVEKNYVPRLSVSESKLLFFKEDLPYRANPEEAQRLLDELEANDRPQKLFNPSQDIPVEPGEFKDIENYFSIQEEFPLVYGTQSAGLPATASVERQAQAKQLKAYLLFFEQLLADFLSQLFHVKDLFSMNDALDTNGDPVINKTYFSQSLINLVPDAAPLYVDPIDHAERLQAMVEDEETFLQRRNRVLDHLMARFAESFADYAMIEYKIDGPKAPSELIEDKLAFLNNYPLISSARGTGFNYLDPCELWHIDNISGVERRVSYLAGVDKPTAALLAFSTNFKITESIPNPDQFYLEIEDTLSTDIMYSPGGPTTGFPSTDDAKLAMEKVILNGIQLDKYQVVDLNDEVLPPPYNSNPVTCRFRLVCDEQVLAVSAITYASTDLAFAAAETQAVPLFTNEYYNNPESNRYNLECFMDKYISTAPGDPQVEAPVDPGCPPKYSWNYTLKNGDPVTPVDYLFGKLSGLFDSSVPPPTPAEQAEVHKEKMFMDMLRTASNISNYRFGVNGLMQEVFTVVDRCGDVIGTSSEEDFNFPIQQQLIQIMGLSGTQEQIRVVGSDGNDGIYTMNANVVMDTVNTQLLKVQVNEPINSSIVGGFIRYDINASMPTSFRPVILDANRADKFFTVDQDLHRIIAPGERIQVTPGPNEGEYTVVKVIQDGSNSLIYVKEDVPSTSGGPWIDYTKLLPIYKLEQTPVNANSFYVKPGMDEVAAKELADWVKLKFFSHEGMHVVEHVLLRPKYNEVGPTLAISAANNNLLQNTPPLGNATYLKGFIITGVAQSARQFLFSGNYKDDFQPLQKIKVAGSPSGLNDNTYTVRSATFSSGSTIVTIYEGIPSGTAGGSLQYSKTVPVDSVVTGDTIIIVDKFWVMPVDNALFITDSLEEVNDGKFKISVDGDLGGGRHKLTFATRVAMIIDDFLPIELTNDCEICRYEDPYSHIISVILPSWQGRFYNQDFRKFLDKLLRLECPAHLVMNICWIDCKQMGEFELHYKKWLQEQSKVSISKFNVSNALNNVIDDISKLRSVYPEGILHDCETDPQEENAIILNQTIIGNL